MLTEWKDFLANAGAEFDPDHGEVRHFGVPVQEASMVYTGNVFADLSHLGLIGVSGEEARDFLHAQLSCDVKGLPANQSCLGGICNPGGRVLAIVRLFALDSRTLALSLPHGLVEPTISHLRKYVLRSKVELHDLSSHYVRLGVSGPEAPRLLGEALGDSLPETVNAVGHCGGHPVLRLPGPQARLEVLLETEAAARVWDRLNVHAAPAGSDAWQLLDHAAGLPVIHPATAGLFIAHSTNLDLVGGISFRKGCYPGQEVIARLQHRGRPNRRMIVARCQSAQRPQPADPVFSADGGEQAVGQVMDARPDGNNAWSLLLSARLDALTNARLYLQGPEGPEVTTGKLPYSIPEMSAD